MTVIASLSALTALWTFLLGTKPTPAPVTCFAALVPTVLILTAFYLIISIRRELVRAAAFVLVFFEEPSEVLGWEGALMKARSRKKGESNDPVSSVLLALIFVSGILLLFSLHHSQADGWIQVLGFGVFALTFFWGIALKRSFDRVVSRDLLQYTEIFRELRAATPDQPYSKTMERARTD